MRLRSRLYKSCDILPPTAVSANMSKIWSVSVATNGQELLFKLHTGEEMTAISDQAMKSLDKTELQCSTERLCGPDTCSGRVSTHLRRFQ